MRAVSEAECGQWLKENINSDFTADKTASEYPNYVGFSISSDSGKKTALARTLIGLLKTDSSGLFWITASGIWPSSENMELFNGYRRSLGESRSVYEAPGHVFSGSDLAQLECILDLTLYFYWDSLLFKGSTAIVMRISHDEYISFSAKDRECLTLIEQNILDLGLKKLQQRR